MREKFYNLILHLRAAKTHMEMNYQFSERWEIFSEMRYDMLSIYFPHKTFSVEECSFDFFSQTLNYLEGRVELPKKETGREFKNNYIDWVTYWKQFNNI